MGTLMIFILTIQSSLAEESQTVTNFSEEHPQQWTWGNDIGLVRRGSVLGAKEVTLSGNAGWVSPERSQAFLGSINGRLGLGYGFMLELLTEASSRDTEVRPGAGFGWQMLGGNERACAVSLWGHYRPEGFAKPEGEFEFTLATTLHWGKIELSDNIVVGKATGGDAGDAEFRTSIDTYLTPEFFVGGETQSRFEFGAAGAEETSNADDHLALATLGLRIEQWSLTGLVGASLRHTALKTTFGPAALIQIGYRL